MAKTVRWGIISTADIGAKSVIPAIHHSKNGEVAAVASRDLDRARAFARANDIPTAYGSYEELLADPDIDAVYNPLPNHLHAAWSIRAAEAGKATLCEKPFASDAAEAQGMVDAFAERGILLAEAFMYRFHPRTRRIKELIDDGIIGDVHVIHAAFSFDIDDEDDIHLKSEMAGGALMDVGCYCINVMRFVTGEEPDRASAQADFGARSGVDERLVGALGFPSGVLGVFDCSMRTPDRQMIEIRGTKGRIVVDLAFVPPEDEAATFQLWRGGEVEMIAIPPANQYQLMVEDFADALLNDRPPRFPPEDGVANMRVIDRLLASAREG
jgi:xylose dehydrogenase (NAD/NADP)